MAGLVLFNPLESTADAPAFCPPVWSQLHDARQHQVQLVLRD